jgi:hypothetical protein
MALNSNAQATHQGLTIETAANMENTSILNYAASDSTISKTIGVAEAVHGQTIGNAQQQQLKSAPPMIHINQQEIEKLKRRRSSRQHNGAGLIKVKIGKLANYETLPFGGGAVGTAAMKQEILKDPGLKRAGGLNQLNSRKTGPSRNGIIKRI